MQKFSDEFKKEFKSALAHLNANIDRLTIELEKERVSEQEWTRKEITNIRLEREKRFLSVENKFNKLRFFFMMAEYPKITIGIFTIMFSLLIEESRAYLLSFIF